MTVSGRASNRRRSLARWLDAPRRLVLGRDVFISYARKDGTAYAAALGSALSDTHSCYLDHHAAPRGRELPRRLRRDLRRASVLEPIATPGARESIHVTAEVESFARTNRPIFTLALLLALEASRRVADAFTTGHPRGAKNPES